MLSNDYYLSAIVGGTRHGEVRTTLFSDDSLDELLKDKPAAMTIARSNVPAAERLLTYWRRYRLTAPAPTVKTSWYLDLHCYFKRAPGERVQSVRVTTYDQLRHRILETRTQKALWCTFFLMEGAADAAFLGAEIEKTFDPIQSQVDTSETHNRKRLEIVNQEMIQKAGGYLTSEELAAALNSRAKNPSQFAADLRSNNKILALRWGAKDWWYPRFQFESNGRPAPEIPELMTALAPDERGWDRLQWLLTPHQQLHGKTPLELWHTDRKAILEAARMERWNDRD